jgi:hypothetical protein
LLLCGCAPRAVLRTGVAPPPQMTLHLAQGSALALRGQLRGPFAGLGPKLRFAVLLVGDGRARADLHYELRGRPQHDVVLWTREGVLSFDRTRGGLHELGEGAALEFAGAKLQLGHVVFLALGRSLPEAAGLWCQRGSRWQAQRDGIEMRSRWQDDLGRSQQQELRWRAGGDERRLTAYVRASNATALGELPQRLELSGHGMRGRLHLELEHEVVAIDELVDFDPLRDR